MEVVDTYPTFFASSIKKATVGKSAVPTCKITLYPAANAGAKISPKFDKAFSFEITPTTTPLNKNCNEISSQQAMITKFLSSEHLCIFS